MYIRNYTNANLFYTLCTISHRLLKSILTISIMKVSVGFKKCE